LSSSSSLPSGLSLCYEDTAIHEPKYSQAELDAAVAKATASLPQQQLQQPQSAQSMLTTNELQRQLDAKEQAFSSLLKKVGERECEWEEREKERGKERELEREEGRLLKSQAKAITHRLKILEEEKTALEEAHKAAIASLTSQHIQESESLTHTIASYKAKLTDASSCISSLEGKLSLVPGELKAAESKGKQYVYDKVKGQFETGNKEFLKVRSQLKTTQDELEALKVMHTSTLSNITSLTTSLAESQQRECEQKTLAAKLTVECDEIKEQLKAKRAEVEGLMTKVKEGEMTVLDKEKERDVVKADLVSAKNEFADLQVSMDKHKYQPNHHTHNPT
jgi:chromosome segregation ATPase